MTNPKRTGMPDAHLRPELKAQNPVYAKARTSRVVFEQERCPLHAQSLRDQHKPEAQRRREAMARGEKHIIVPASFEAFIARPKPSKSKHEQPHPTLKPPWAVRRQAFLAKRTANANTPTQSHQQNKETTMSEAPPGGNDRQSKAPEIVLTDGALKAASWREEGEYGPFFNTKITRRYTNADGEVRETGSLRERDLLPAAELAGEVHRTIRDRKREQTLDRTQSHAKENACQTEDWHDDTLTDREVREQRFRKDREPRQTQRKRPRNQSQDY